MVPHQVKVYGEGSITLALRCLEDLPIQGGLPLQFAFCSLDQLSEENARLRSLKSRPLQPGLPVRSRWLE